MTPRSPFQRFMAELRRRHVPQTAAVYAVAAWAAIQFADVVVPNLGWPQWVVTAVIVAAGLGFPVMLALTWILEWGPDGIHRTAPPEGTERVGDAHRAGASTSSGSSTSAGGAGGRQAPWVMAVSVLAVGIGTAIVVAGLVGVGGGGGNGSGSDDGGGDAALSPDGAPTRFERRRAQEPTVPPAPRLDEIMAPGYTEALTHAINDSIAGALGEGFEINELVEMARRIGAEAGTMRSADGPVGILEPQNWRFQAPQPVSQGDTLVVRGIARAPDGITAVTVDGRVVVEPDGEPPTFPFVAEWVAPAARGARTVTITVRTATGEEIERRFPVIVIPPATEG